MTAKILVVDDLPLNVRILSAKLAAEYYDVLTASSGPEALSVIAGNNPDLVLLDVMMPGMNGLEVCARIRENPRICHIPVIMVTALTDTRDRVAGIEAGADDFLSKPIDDIELFARVKSLLRLKMLLDELRLRRETSANFALGNESGIRDEVRDPRILAVIPDPAECCRVVPVLEQNARVWATVVHEEIMEVIRNEDIDLAVLDLGREPMDGLRLASHLRSLDRSRHLPVLGIADGSDRQRIIKSLDLGVNDYIVRPVDPNELLARTRTQIRRKRYQDQLRQSFLASVLQSVTDELTGLHNRRYILTHLETRRKERESTFSLHRRLAILLFDIDHFKAINDTHGHPAGDEILRQFSGRILKNLRGIDLAARFGGEEFIVALPDADAETALTVAERLRQAFESPPCTIGTPPEQIRVTASIGLALAGSGHEPVDDIIRRADRAMYIAKRNGRNQVVLCPDGERSSGKEEAEVMALSSAPLPASG